MKTVNCHMHLLNFDFIPDSYFKTQTKIPEWLVRMKIVRVVLNGVIELFHIKSLNHGYDIAEIMTKEIDEIINAYIVEMDEAGLIIATPLMLDIEIGANMEPEIPYNQQVSIISELCLKTKGRLMPFISVDPRRSNAFEIMIDALENKGFLGVKLYPPLGYNIDPYNVYNVEHGYDEALHNIYSYCSKYEIPITTHCSKGGAYSSELVKEKAFGDYLSHPKHIAKVLAAYPNLIVNIAHLGGDLHQYGYEDNWAESALKLAKKYKHVYCDVCCQTQSFKPELEGSFVEIIRKVLNHKHLSHKIIYGTDWPISGIEYNEKEFLEEMKKVLGPNHQKVMTSNPKAFLFNKNQLPDRIVEVYHKNNIIIRDDVLSFIEGE